MQQPSKNKHHVLLAIAFSLGILVGAGVMAVKTQVVLKTVEAKVTSQKITESTRMEALLQQVSGAQTQTVE